jgi:hypothetical protein
LAKVLSKETISPPCHQFLVSEQEICSAYPKKYMVVRIGRARGHGRGRPTTNAKVLEEMRELRSLMEAMELGRQRDREAGDVSEPAEEEQGEEATPMQETLN